MIHFAKFLAIKLWLISIPLLALIALSLVVFSQWLPSVSQYRPEVESWVSETLQRPVRLGGLSARWQGLGPELVLTDMEIMSAGKPALKLAEVRISLAMLESLLALEIRPRRIILSRIRLLLRWQADETLAIVGLDSPRSMGSESSLMGIPYQIRIEDGEIAWENQVSGAAPRLYSRVNADLINGIDRHQLNARLPIPGAPEGSLELRADIRGDIGTPGDWGADIYLKGVQVPLIELFRVQAMQGPGLNRGTVDTETWLRWEQGGLSGAEGHLDLRQLQGVTAGETESTAGTRTLEIDRLGGNFRWLRQTNGWRLDVSDIDLAREGRGWPDAAFSLETRYDDQNRLTVVAGADFARVDDLVAIAGFLPITPAELKDTLTSVAPQSNLRDLKFRYQEHDRRNLWSARGVFDSLTTRAWRGIPGVLDLDGRFWVDQDQGALQLDSSGTEIDFPNLFRNPLKLKRLQGALTWTREADGGWRLDTREMVAITRDIQTRTRFSLDIPAEPEQSMFMDLQTDFRDGRAINAHHYYPVGIMPQAVVEWLDRSIVEGQVVTGSALVRGPLDDFPYHDTHNGRFEVFFRGEGMTVDYWPGWPRLTKVASQVRFLNNSFDIWIEGGRILDSRLDAAEGGIRDLAGSSPFELKGAVSGPFQDTLRLLRESPLAADFSSLTEGLRAEGEVHTNVDMAIPIDSDGSFRLDGSLDLDGSTLSLEEWQLPLTSIQGTLNFSHDRVAAKGIKAHALGSDITIDATTLDATTRISAEGEFSRETLIKRLPDLSALPFSGASRWRLQLDLPNEADRRTSVTVQGATDLKGTAVDLPPPFGKSREQKSLLRLSTTLDSRAPQPLRAEYAELLDLLLVRGKSGVESLAVQLGGGQAKLPEAPGIEVRGTLPLLDIGSWARLVGGLPATDGGPTLKTVQLRLERATIGEVAFDQLEVDLHRRENLLHGGIGSHRLAGTIEIPLDLSLLPIKARLSRIDLEFDPANLAKTSMQDEPLLPSSVVPAELPSLDLEVERVDINGHDFGQLRMITRRLPDGLELQKLSLDSSLAQLSASGGWVQSATPTNTTRIDISLASKSMGELLEKLGFSRNIDGAPAEFESNMRWNDAPLNYRPEILNGKISLRLGSGRFLEVNPGVGRIFGLLNISALQRRLRLDFTDLTKKGLAFDRIEGSFLVDDGDAYTSNLTIEGPAAQIHISGRTGLATEDFDQLITVTPRVSVALPVAGFLAGGPVGGAAMLLAQGLFGEEFDKASRRQYQVRGPWEDPVFTPSQEATQQEARPGPPLSEENRSAPVQPRVQAENQHLRTDNLPQPPAAQSAEGQPEEKKNFLQQLKNSFTPRAVGPEQPEVELPDVD